MELVNNMSEQVKPRKLAPNAVHDKKWRSPKKGNKSEKRYDRGQILKMFSQDVCPPQHIPDDILPLYVHETLVPALKVQGFPEGLSEMVNARKHIHKEWEKKEGKGSELVENKEKGPSPIKDESPRVQEKTEVENKKIDSKDREVEEVKKNPVESKPIAKIIEKKEEQGGFWDDDEVQEDCVGDRKNTEKVEEEAKKIKKTNETKHDEHANKKKEKNSGKKEEHTENKQKHDSKIKHEPEPKLDHKQKHEPDHKPDHKAKPEPEHKSKHEHEHKPDHKAKHEPDHKPKHEPDHKQKHEPDHKQKHESDHKQKHESDHKPKHEPEPKPDNKPKHEPEHRPKNEPEPKPKPKHESELKPKPKHEPEPKPTPKHEPVHKPDQNLDKPSEKPKKDKKNKKKPKKTDPENPASPVANEPPKPEYLSFEKSLIDQYVQKGNPFAKAMLHIGVSDDPQKIYIAKNSVIYERVWFYRDRESRVQGPFSCIEMFNWTVRNFFPESLEISFCNTEFVPMNSYLSSRTVAKSSPSQRKPEPESFPSLGS